MKLSGIPQVSQFEHHKKEPAIAASNIIKIDSSMYNNKDKNNYLILNKPNGSEEEKDNFPSSNPYQRVGCVNKKHCLHIGSLGAQGVWQRE